ncbi:hypothetical protein ASPCADRAFT_510207 [Aspergillus carbonarius ITEM 5010]|uniref:Aflatoxin regulatory protein domain-containing protein n=1 Tax=Aspergillus carbonarius (strain ITEM 5010) TaxID=602072 RepID=A0A1R3RA72_ASPC5|nr:hypothetical protein ASPCADRAFT_510207 [Aspergillus carbonarius ITEM 5010]
MYPQCSTQGRPSAKFTQYKAQAVANWLAQHCKAHTPPRDRNFNENSLMVDLDPFSTVSHLTAPTQASSSVTSDSVVSMDTATPATYSVPSIWDKESDENNAPMDSGQDMTTWSAQGTEHLSASNQFLLSIHRFKIYPTQRTVILIRTGLAESYDSLNLESRNEPTPEVNEIEDSHHPNLYGSIDRNETILDYTPSSSSSHAQGSIMVQQSQSKSTCQALTGETFQGTFHDRGDFAAQAGVSIPSYEWLSRTKIVTCLPKLVELNMSLLRLSEKARMATSQSLKAPAGHQNEVIIEMVQFSRELIDLMACIMPTPRSGRDSLPSQSIPDIFCSTYNSIPYSGSISHCLDTDTYVRYDISSHAASSGCIEAGSQSDSMSASTLIFLAMGCYTQDSAGSASQSRSGSSLETCLHIHTITYLLDHLHKAMYPYPHDITLDDEFDNIVYNENDRQCVQDQSCATPVFGKSSAGVLLGQASWEIGEREKSLMSKIQTLSHILNVSRYYN